MSKRALVRALRKAGCTMLRDTGSHEAWGCPCEKHIAALPRHRTISAYVVKKIIEQLECLPRGWLE
jgi:predicted RNA binding protein YcfA (HicA-like mRNA interferase family)